MPPGMARIVTLRGSNKFSWSQSGLSHQSSTVCMYVWRYLCVHAWVYMQACIQISSLNHWAQFLWKLNVWMGEENLSKWPRLFVVFRIKPWWCRGFKQQFYHKCPCRAFSRALQTEKLKYLLVSNDWCIIWILRTTISEPHKLSLTCI